MDMQMRRINRNRLNYSELMVEKSVQIQFPLHQHEVTELIKPSLSADEEERYRLFCQKTVFGGQRVPYEKFCAAGDENKDDEEIPERLSDKQCSAYEMEGTTIDRYRGIDSDFISLHENMHVGINNIDSMHWCCVSTTAKSIVHMPLAPSVDDMDAFEKLTPSLECGDLLGKDIVIDQIMENLLEYLCRPPLTIRTEVFGVITSKRPVEDDPLKNFLLGRGSRLPTNMGGIAKENEHTNGQFKDDDMTYGVVIGCDGRERKFTEDEITLYWAARHNRLALVTGTGVSMALTQNRLSLWDDFILHLRREIWPTRTEYEEQRRIKGQQFSHMYQSKSTFDLELFKSLSGDPHAQSEYLYLCAERDDCLHTLVSEILQIVGQLVPLPEQRKVWSEALLGFSGPILTFNYDIALEIVVGRLPATACASIASLSDIELSHSTTISDHKYGKYRSNSGRSQSQDPTHFQAHSISQTVMHLHGIYTNDQSVVLRLQSYLDAVKTVSETFVSLAEKGFIFLFVGIKGVLCDPDLFPYWRWEDVRQRIQDHATRPCKRTHFAIFRKDEDIIFPRRITINPHEDDKYSFFKSIIAESYDEIPSILKDIVNLRYCERTS